jgi:hypothetical protein
LCEGLTFELYIRRQELLQLGQQRVDLGFAGIRLVQYGQDDGGTVVGSGSILGPDGPVSEPIGPTESHARNVLDPHRRAFSRQNHNRFEVLQ